MQISQLFKSKIFLTIVAFLITLALSRIVFAQGTAQFMGGNIMTGVNNTQRNADWGDPVNANPGEVIEFRVVAQNTASGATANNVKITASLPSDPANPVVASSTVSADNASSVSDTLTVNITGGSQQGFAYISGHARIFSPSCPSGCSAPDTVTSGGVSVGNLAFGESAQVLFKAYVTNNVVATPTPTGTMTPTPTGTMTPTPTLTPIGTLTPTPTGTIIPTPTGTIAPSPTTTGGNVVSCPAGFTQTVSGSNIICVQQVQNQSQSSSSNSSTGPVNVNVSSPATTTSTTTNTTTSAPVATTTTTAAPGTVPAVTELPKTGLPLAAWALSGLLPLGAGLRKFRGREEKLGEDNPEYLWQKREFSKKA